MIARTFSFPLTLAGFYLTACSDHEEITIICKILAQNHVTVTKSFHFINHGEIMKKSRSQYQIWWKITITITSRYQIHGRGKTLITHACTLTNMHTHTYTCMHSTHAPAHTHTPLYCWTNTDTFTNSNKPYQKTVFVLVWVFRPVLVLARIFRHASSNYPVWV